MIMDWHGKYGLGRKPEIQKILDKNRALGHTNGVNDFFGFGDLIFDLREFVMRGLKAINDPTINFLDLLHLMTTPCHFSVVPGIKNLAQLISLSLIVRMTLKKASQPGLISAQISPVLLCE